MVTVTTLYQVSGAIYWARQLLHRIEEPMKVFRDVKAVSSLKDFGRICKVSARPAENSWMCHVDCGQ